MKEQNNNNMILTHQVTMSYLEIYNENIRDLLNPGTGYLELRDDSRARNVQVTGLTEVSTNSTEEVINNVILLKIINSLFNKFLHTHYLFR